MPKFENVTKFNITITDAQGNTEPREYLSEAQVNDIKAEAAKEGKTVAETKAQTFKITQAESIDDILQCVPNVEVALGNFNYGYKLSQQNVMRDLMKDPDWAGVEGAYDLNQDVQTPKEKRVADPQAATKRSLRATLVKMGLPEPTDEELNMALAAMLAQFQQAAAPTA